jgi:ribose 5-phosphate isomerase B
LGARLISQQAALEIVRIWLETDFDGGRHLKRIRLIAETENQIRRTYPL